MRLMERHPSYFDEAKSCFPARLEVWRLLAWNPMSRIICVRRWSHGPGVFPAPPTNF